MLKSRILAGLGIPLFITIFSLSFRPESNPETTITDRLESRQEILKTTAADFARVIKSGDMKSAATVYRKLRNAFKAWEYLGEFRHPALVKDYINGAPLPRPEENAFGAVILQPQGLQVIDELMGDPDQDSAREKLEFLATRLSETLQSLPLVSICYDHEVFEAARIELIRIFSLGLTGFDTPGTSCALEDALVALTTLNADLELFLNTKKASSLPVTDTLKLAFRRGQSMLSAKTGFDKFDRAAFLRGVINPLFKSIKELQLQLEIPFPREVRNTPAALNYQSDFLFAADFLDPSFYSGLPDVFRTTAVRDLGMTLFFDPVLSSNNKRACAGCHDPAQAFTDGRPKSLAMDLKGTVERNSPTLVNCVYSERFFHDLRAEALEDQMTHVITDSREFNTDVHNIIDKLKRSAEYRQLFSDAFTGYPGETINPQTIGFAISAYVGSLHGFNSSFDRYARGESNDLHPDAISGFNLFMGKAACGTCHFAPLFSGTVPPEFAESESEVLGVPVSWPAKKPAADTDPGRGAARIKDQLPIYRYSFKTPTVRNAGVTGPYMHNGGMASLEAVMDFYNKGGGNGIGLQFEHQTLSDAPLNLSKREIRQVIAFINSLTDFNALKTRPSRLPSFADSLLDNRVIGGEY